MHGQRRHRGSRRSDVEAALPHLGGEPARAVIRGHAGEFLHRRARLHRARGPPVPADAVHLSAGASRIDPDRVRRLVVAARAHAVGTIVERQACAATVIALAAIEATPGRRVVDSGTCQLTQPSRGSFGSAAVTALRTATSTASVRAANALTCSLLVLQRRVDRLQRRVAVDHRERAHQRTLLLGRLGRAVQRQHTLLVARRSACPAVPRRGYPRRCCACRCRAAPALRRVAVDDADLAHRVDAHSRFAIAVGDLAQAGEVAADRDRLPPVHSARSAGRRVCAAPRSRPSRPACGSPWFASSSVLAFSAAWYTASLRLGDHPGLQHFLLHVGDCRSCRASSSRVERLARHRRCRCCGSPRLAAPRPSNASSAASIWLRFRRIDLAEHEQRALLDQLRLRYRPAPS